MYQCARCGFVSNYESEIARHIKIRHPDIGYGDSLISLVVSITDTSTVSTDTTTDDLSTGGASGTWDDD